MFVDRNPRGFGLLQRDRNFDHYQDDGVFCERPCLWVEPKGEWGEGSVQLVETVDETFDNIVAFWNPKEKPQPGQELLVGYRLYWGAEPPARPPLAHCVASRTGLGGVVGKREYFSWRAVDFEGGELARLIDKAEVEAVVKPAVAGSRSFRRARCARSTAIARCSTWCRRKAVPSRSTSACSCAVVARPSPRPGCTSTPRRRWVRRSGRCTEWFGIAGLATLHPLQANVKCVHSVGWRVRLRGRCKYVL